MEVDALAAESARIIQDPEYDEKWAIGKFNECLRLVAAMCLIPGLQTTEAVNVAEATSLVPMPKSYLHDLYRANTATYPDGLLIAPNNKELVAMFPAGQTGNIIAVSVDGSTLHVRPVPAADELVTLSYYGKPKELSAGDTFPNYIPEALHKDIFLNYALKEAYSQIEDGIDGKYPNTEKYGARASMGIDLLKRFYGDAPKARPELRRGGSHF